MGRHQRKPPQKPQELNLVLINRMRRIRPGVISGKAKALGIAEILQEVICPDAAAVLVEFNAMAKSFAGQRQKDRQSYLKLGDRNAFARARDQLQRQAAEQAKLAPTLSVPAVELLGRINGALPDASSHPLADMGPGW